MADGRTFAADLVVAADGATRSSATAWASLPKRKYLVDGCTRLLIDKTPEEMGTDGATTVEYWSGSRRVLYTPCSETKSISRSPCSTATRREGNPGQPAKPGSAGFRTLRI